MSDRIVNNLNVEVFVMIDGYIWRKVRMSKFLLAETPEGSKVEVEGVLTDPHGEIDSDE